MSAFMDRFFNLSKLDRLLYGRYNTVPLRLGIVMISNFSTDVLFCKRCF